MADLALRPGDRVLVSTVLSGLSGGSCRSVEKTVARVDEVEDKVYFTDGSTYNYRENPGLTLERA